MGNVEYDVAVTAPSGSYYANPLQVMYDKAKLCVDILYNTMVDLADEVEECLSLITPIYLDMLSDMSFKIIDVVDGEIVIPDFRWPVKTVDGYNITLPGFSFNLTGVIPFFQLFNFKLTDMDFEWIDRSTNTHYWGSTRDRYWMFGDLVVDGITIAIIGGIIAGLRKVGMKHHSEEFSSRLSSVGSFSKIYSSFASTLKTIDTNTKVASTLSTVTGTAGKVVAMEPVINALPASISQIVLQLISISNNLSNIVNRLLPEGESVDLSSLQDDVGVIKTKLENLANVIGLRLSL